MAPFFGKRLRELRTQRQILQASFAQTCQISAAYLSDIERGRRNPPADRTILEWAGHLDPGNAEEIGQELVALAARDRDQAEAVTVDVVEPAGSIWRAAPERRDAEDEKPVRGKKSQTPFLDHFQWDLLEMARQGRLDPAPGRAREFDEIAAALACRRRNSAVLTGSSGAEIWQVVQGLGHAVAAGQSPENLIGKRLLRLDGLQAGVKYRGQLEERVRAVVTEAAVVGDVLLHFHSLGDVLDLEKSLNGSLLGPAQEEGTLQVITGALPGEMDHCRKLNPRLVECFRAVPVRALDRDGVLRGLYEVRERYGSHHGVTYSDAALVAIVDAAVEDEPEGFWQRSVDLLDEVGARVRLEGGGDEVTVEDVDRATSAAPEAQARPM